MCEKCEICKKKPAMICIDGKYNYCYDCYNKMVLEEAGIDNDFDCTGNISVMEPDGSMHFFEITHVILGDIVSWEANENGGEYQFRFILDIREDGKEAAGKFFKKIVSGVCTKTLEHHEERWISADSLKNKGIIRIMADEGRNFAPAFEIDGKKFTPDELARLFISYEGFNILFQINDSSDPLLGEDEYLVPVKITKDTLIEELEEALAITTDRSGFLSYKQVPVFNEFFYRIMDKLKILEQSGPEKALSAGIAIAKRLREVENDDDWFPVGNIWTIRDIVDRAGMNDELKRLYGEE